MTDTDELQQLRNQVASLKEDLADAEDDITDLRAELAGRPDPDGPTAEDYEMILERIHYTTPGLRQVLIQGGAHRNDVAELTGLLKLPVG